MKEYLKYFLTLLMAGMISTDLMANDKEPVSSMLFPQFEDGYVVPKANRGRVAAKLNYDKVAEKVVYMDNNTLYELDDNTVTVVVIKERVFIPSGKKFYYERVAAGENEYFVRHRTKVVSKGKAAGYGSYSETSAISGIASVSHSSDLYNIGVDEKFDGKDETGVFVINGKKHVRISSLKSLVNLFKKHQAAIETYAKANKTDFAKAEHVIAIVEYAFSL
jgi:hypothetical protein